MKFVYIANIRLPTEKAHGIQIMKMCEAFARAGADVSVIVPTRKNPSFAGVDPFDYYGVERNFTIKRMNAIDPWWLLRLPQGVYIKAQAGLFVVSLFVYWLLRKPPLSPLLAKEGMGRSHILYTRDEYLISLLLRLGKRVVWEAHTLPSRAAAYVKYWKRCEKIVAITHGLKVDLMRLGVDAAEIIVAADGVDLKQFDIRNTKAEIRSQLGLPQDKFIVMYTGHLYEWKGAGVLLEAARSFQFPVSSFQLDSRLEVLFVFVGGTEPDVAKFREKTEQDRLDNVRIIGHRPPSEIPRWLKAADILVLPNSRTSLISERYTSPLKLFEYKASGVPIIASDVPALREILNDGNAFFFAADDPSDLVNKIACTLYHQGDAARRAAQAAEDIQKFTWDARARNIMATLREHV